MKTLAISGAGGFLGRNLLSLAEPDRFEIYALTSKSGSAPGVHYVGRESFDEIPWERVDVLINCAFPRNTDGLQMAQGLDYIRRLLRAAADGGVGAVINISSQSVYSQKRGGAADESEPLNLESTYAVGKFATELLLDEICRAIAHTNLRMASLIGPGFDQRLVNKFVKKAVSGEEIHIREGRQQFGFLDVRDAAEAILRVAERTDLAWDAVYNLGTDQAYSLRDIADVVKTVVEREMGREVSVTAEPGEDVLCSALNAQKLYRTFDWRPNFSLEQTVQAICRRELGAIEEKHA